MVYGVFKVLVGILCICVTSSGGFLLAECSIDTIIVNGKVEHAPRKGIVKVQLIYPKDKIGESGDVTVDDGSFRIPILFFTQSRTFPEWEYSHPKVHPEAANRRRLVDCQ